MSHHSDEEEVPAVREEPQPVVEDSVTRPLVLNPSTHSNPSLLSQPQEQPPLPPIKSRRRMKVLQVLSGICILVSLVIALAVPPLLHSVILQKAIDQVTLQSSNEGTWAHFPGDTNTIITRNFTFFTLENPMKFLFAHEKPRFKETSGFKVQELEDFLDIEYLEGGNKVAVKDRIWYK